MNKRRSIIMAVLLVMAGAYFAYDYLYKDHRDIASENSSLEITADYLLERFQTEKGEELLNRTITVTGLVTQVESDGLTLDFSVYCSMNTEKLTILTDKKVKIKGRCIGYDDLFEVVKLDQCTLIKE